ncbi:hypothetical protein GCM10009750_17140 [Agromyces salentinus]|uniref:ATP-binding protein n=2 Tax=Agromyces salentinus TaxID=269421 RepID=A0ABP4YWT6_9MICO
MPPRPDDVFIPGGLPIETYVSRDHLNLEEALADWLEGRQKPLLAVSGPTKSGKTVLIRRLVPDPILLSGGAIETAEDFWESVCEELEVFTDHSLSLSTEDTDGFGMTGGASAGFVQGAASTQNDRSTGRGVTRSRTASSRSAARAALRKTKRVIYIDDFHYIPPDQQLPIIRGLKDLIFDGLGVVVAAVPHRAYDVVRVEKEMTGRVTPFPVAQWSVEDLQLIASQGFAALGVTVDDAISLKLANESFGSPHLMQMHCLNLCKVNREGGVLRAAFIEPDWPSFFEKQASATSKSAFDLLKNGPRTRRDRLPRTLKSGVVTDIYGAVLAAIANTGPRTTLSYDEIRASLRDLLASGMPQSNEITNVLDQMTDIAKTKIEGEPVLEYSIEYSRLDLVDPYFAYYLRWASPEEKDLAIPTKA